ncbi:hypothetical protein GIB67_035648 [Kingdonia uniflora]|uniref:Uncharacterized protein n=1 Tax=Kingdonia uniflora TaxID=39325 RepID=A0A7J7KUU7_9MAGN|nr:hypothetical protein GIB67_035648 [Kingdonia uniflora]
MMMGVERMVEGEFWEDGVDGVELLPLVPEFAIWGERRVDSEAYKASSPSSSSSSSSSLMEKFLLRDLSSEESSIQIRQRSADEASVLHQIHDPQIEEMVVQQGEQNTPAESQDTNLNSNVPLSPKDSKEKESGTKRKSASIVWDHFTIVEGTRKVPIRAECNYFKTGFKCERKEGINGSAEGITGSAEGINGSAH